MASGPTQDPKLLYAVHGVQGFHLADGHEVGLTPSGPQTLSLLMVPTSTSSADPDGPSQQDFYLHLHLPPELDLPLPATTQIYHQPPSSYLIPRWDLSTPAFTRIEFPAIGSRKGLQEDIDTFETILAQCTSFLERSVAPATPSDAKTPASAASPPGGESRQEEAGGMTANNSRKPDARGAVSSKARDRDAVDEELPAYNPGNFAPGEAYARGSRTRQQHNGDRIVLINEEDGSVLGELEDGFQLIEAGAIRPGSKDPVEITFPADGQTNITIQPASREYVEMEMHPSFNKSSMVSVARKASRLVVTTSDLVITALQDKGHSLLVSTQPAKPVVFKPTTRENIRRINEFSAKAAHLSASTVVAIGNMAQNLGAALGRRKNARGHDEHGRLTEDYQPGLLNKSLMAFNTMADGIEQAGRNLLVGTSGTVSSVVAHRYGAEAGEVVHNVADGFKNVGLVYIDVTGVSRRAILKGVAKGMVVGRVGQSGASLVVGGGDGGSVVLPANQGNYDIKRPDAK